MTTSGTLFPAERTERTAAELLAGKVAVVTGAGRGIGRAIAIGYARAGAAVCCSARSEVEIAETAQAIAAAGGRASFFAADVTSYPEVKRLFDHAEIHLGGVDLVVINAGASVENRLVEESEPAMWKDAIEVNLIGAYHTARAAISYLRKRGAGKMIFVGSGMGHRGSPTRSAYATSKAGLWMLTRVLAQELAAHSICVNELVPGPVLTDFIRGREAEMRAASGGIEWFKQPEEVVPLALFLAAQPENGPTGQSFSLARREL
jgi:3-oxoacyl-[acyl-carrier protein] reductase